MSLTAYPTLRLKLTMPTALKLQFLPAVPGFNASQVANKVDRAGDTMQGQLLLAADPSFPLEAATKQYVDAHSGGSLSLAASKLAGRGSASGTGAAEQITLGTNLTMSGTTLNATGGGGTGNVTYTASSTAPVSPAAGDLWYDLTTGVLSIRVNDGTSSQWVMVAPAGAGGLATVTIQKFTASGTYTPTSGMKYCLIECLGGGGAGGGAFGVAGTPGTAGGGGGGAGGYSRKVGTAATIGASQTITIGAGGAAGAAGNVAGGNGGDTSLGALCIGKGGTGGSGSAVASNAPGGAGGVAGTGDVTTTGATGGSSLGFNVLGAYINSGFGASSPFGGGGVSVTNAGGSFNGNAATGFGSGGSGGGNQGNATSSVAGGAGSPGIIIITEFV